MDEISDKVREDFDRIALLSDDGWDHNKHYHPFLLKNIPLRCENSLEIGCGEGGFSRLLAARSERVVAIDLSDQMIRLARERSAGCPNIEYFVADAVTWPFPQNHFDCAVSMATMHHLPIEDTLLKMKQSLKTGGVLIILDIYEPRGWRENLDGLIAVPANYALRLIKTGRLREPRAVREAWAEHGRNESYPTMLDMRKICDSILPGARLRRHLLWRYSLIWKKPPFEHN